MRRSLNDHFPYKKIPDKNEEEKVHRPQNPLAATGPTQHHHSTPSITEAGPPMGPAFILPGPSSFVQNLKPRKCRPFYC